MFGSLNNFQQRFLLSIVCIFLIGCILYFSHVPPFTYLFVAAVGIIQALALWEYYNLAKKKKITPQSILGIVFSLLYVVLIYLNPPYNYTTTGFLFLFTTTAFIAQCKNYVNGLVALATTIFGVIYITIPLSFLIPLNFSSAEISSSFWIIYLIVTTKMTDTSAYIAGKTIGKHLIAPVLSPKKTWEGAIAGLFGSALTSVLFFMLAPSLRFYEGSSVTLIEAIYLGVAISLFAQLGDLAESLLKRDAGVKDSNNLPGFGGFLDIVDSLIFTTPLLFFWLTMKQLI